MSRLPRLSRLLLVTALLTFASFALVHCSDAPVAPARGPVSLDDAGAVDAGATGSETGPAPEQDASSEKWTTVLGFDPTKPPTTEMEPNNGSTAAEINTLIIPGRLDGAIGMPDDADIFGVSFTTGTFYSLRIIPDGSNLEPKLTVFDTNRNGPNPTRIVRSGKATSPRLLYFALGAGTFVTAAQDRRNVGTAPRVGGPNFKYTIEATTVKTTPIKVTFPMTVRDTLQHPGDLGVMTFTGTRGLGFSIVVKAARKATPSQLDTRVSLFSLSTNSNVITNDNLPSSTDSEVRGQLPFDGDYLLVVEDEADHITESPSALDLSYEVEFKTN